MSSSAGTAVPLKHRNITLERFEKFLSKDYWRDINLRGALYGCRAPLANITHLALPTPQNFERAVRPGFNDVVRTSEQQSDVTMAGAEWSKCTVGQSFGPTWSTHWFWLHVRIPTEEQDASFLGKPVHLRWEFEGEGMLYAANDMTLHMRKGAGTRALNFAAGDAVVAFTGGGGDDALWRSELELVPAAKGGEEFYFYVECACNGMFGSGDGGMIAPPDVDRQFSLGTAEIAVFRPCIWAMLVDFQMTYECAKFGRPDGAGFGIVESGTWDAATAEALYVGNEFLNHIDVHDEQTWAGAHRLLSKFLRGRGGGGGDANLPVTGKCAESDEAARLTRAHSLTEGRHDRHTICALGHCHIDTAWLWPYAETRRKVARSWASQLLLQKQYDNSIFVASSAQHFEWLKHDQPALFERVRQAARDGRFVPTGGTWVEMDANLPSGESFARQFVFGQLFFRREFGCSPRVFWLPDTFGYAANLPQIMRLAGCEYFFTQKLSWSLVNTFPHTTFNWEGLDGSNVLTHFAPADTYNARVSIDELRKHTTCSATGKGNRDLERFGLGAPSLLLYGHGDGGGGPDKMMHARLERLDHSTAFQRAHLPSVQHATPEEFFDALAARARERPPQRWCGELYLELHQGTFTSQAQIKRYNRVAEVLLRTAETFSIIAACMSCSGHASAAKSNFMYPADALSEIWKGVLLHQFHDVIPGSSIGLVYRDTDEFFSEVLGNPGNKEGSLKHLIDAAITECVHKAASSNAHPAKKRKTGTTNNIILVNALPFEREELIDVCNEGATRTELRLVRIPALGWSSLSHAVVQSDVPMRICQCSCDDSTKQIMLKNAYVTVTLTRGGAVQSFVDRRVLPPRQCVASGKVANRLVMHDDIPFFWDAWDTMPYHLEAVNVLNDADSALVISSEVIEDGPLRCAVRFSYRKRPSDPSPWMQLIIRLGCTSAQLDFDLQVDWHERHKFLKVEHDLNVRASFATYDTQFGCVQRPTHANTSWDWAKYEVCAHQWCDISERGFGVAMLNDSKYGHSCRGSKLCLSLLRSPKSPDRDCDMGPQVARWALLPHAGLQSTCGGKEITQAAARFNTALQQVAVETQQALSSEAVQSVCYLSIAELTEGLCVNLSAVKAAEDGKEGVVIVRVFEAIGGRGRAILHSSYPHIDLANAVVCNLLEEELESTAICASSPQSLSFDIEPFQVLTFRIESR